MQEEKIVYVQLIPVVDLETGEVLEINRDDVLKIENGQRCFIFFTKDGRKYRTTQKQEELEEAWYKYGFRSYDNTNITNMNNAQSYDFERGAIFFDRDPAKDSLCASVAKINESDLLKEMPKFGIRALNDSRYFANNQVKMKPRMV